MFEITGASISRLVAGPYDGWMVWRHYRGDVAVPVTRDRLGIVFQHRATAEAVIESDRLRIGWFWRPDNGTAFRQLMPDVDFNAAVTRARDPESITAMDDLGELILASSVADWLAHRLGRTDPRSRGSDPMRPATDYWSTAMCGPGSEPFDPERARTLMTPSVAEHLALGRVMLFDMLTAEHSRRPT